MTSQISKEQHLGALALIIYTILTLFNQLFMAGVTGPLILYLYVKNVTE